MLGDKRIEYLDYAKGIGILLVALIHIYAFNPDINRDNFVVWVHSFHMPLFFIISGILLKHKDVQLNYKAIKNRIKGLLIPYLIFSIITIMVKTITEGFSIISVIKKCILTLVGAGLDVLWFIPALFIGELTFLSINKFVKKDYFKILLILVLFLVATYINVENFLIVIIIARAVMATVFITIGYYTYNIIVNKEFTLMSLIFTFLGQVFFAKLNGFVDLNNLIFNNNILYIMNSVIGSIVIIQLCKNIYNSEILSYFGKNSIVILGMHLNIIYLFRHFIKMNMYGYISGLMLLIGLLLVELPMISLYKNYIKKYLKGHEKFTSSSKTKLLHA